MAARRSTYLPQQISPSKGLWLQVSLHTVYYHEPCHVINVADLLLQTLLPVLLATRVYVSSHLKPTGQRDSTERSSLQRCVHTTVATALRMELDFAIMGMARRHLLEGGAGEGGG